MESHPALANGTMLLALTGWMDGGLVSTGTVKEMMQKRELERIATIEADPFYIYNFPGSMEITSLFRPEVKHEGGVIERFEMPGNTFHAGEKSAAGVLFCKSQGYVNPMNSAYDLKGQSYRLDIPVGQGERNVQKALDEGHVVTFFDAKYPRFR